MRLGLLGPGRIAAKAVAPAIAASAAVRLEVVGSRSLARARALAEPCGARAVEGYEAVLRDPGVEGVYIALPNALHTEWALKAAAAGKHVLCEKPACRSVAETEQVLAACRRAGVRFMEAYMFRYHPQHAAVRELLRHGDAGEVHHLDAAFGFPPLEAGNFRYDPRLGGGAFADAAGYPVAAARMLFGEEPEAVCAFAHDDAARGVDVRGVLQLRFPSGRTAQAAFGFTYSYRNAYALWGSRGRIEAARAFSLPPTLAPTITVTTPDGVRTVTAPAADQFRLMLEAFGAAVRSPADGALEAECLAQALVMEAAWQSAQEGRCLRLDGAPQKPVAIPHHL